MADVHLLSRALWPSTLCLIICVIHQSTLQRLRDHWKLTCSLLTTTLSTLEVLPCNALDKSTYLLTYIAEKPMLHANFTAVCVVEAELLAMEYSTCGDQIGSLSNAVLRCGNMQCRPFCSCEPDLDLYSLKTHWMCKYELPIHTYRETQMKL